MRRLVEDGFWELVEPLLPPEAGKPRGGRPRVPDRAALEGILYVLRSGIPWRMLPEEFGCSGVTCWRRLRDWQEAGVWRRPRRGPPQQAGQTGLLARVRGAGGLGRPTAQQGGGRR